MKRIRFVFNLVTVISLLLGVIWLSPTPADAAPTFASLGQIRAEGLQAPGAMDLDAAGNLYVADARGGQVYKFNPYGSLLNSFALQGTGRGLAVTPDGRRLYVSRLNSVVVFDVALEAEVGLLAGAEANAAEFNVAGEIDLDANGNVFVVDAGRMQVKIYSSSGAYQSRFGGVGTAAGQFLEIGGMAINPAGQVVVADDSRLNGKIHVFEISSSLVATEVAAYSKDSSFGPTPMFTPRGMTFDSLGRGYFLEGMASQIRVSDSAFTSLGSYMQAGYGVGQLNNIRDAIFDNVNSRLFVGCDTARIEIFGIDNGQNPVSVNHAPTTPTPQSPIGSSEVASTTPVFVFGNATDADGDNLTYEVTITHGGEVVAQVQTVGLAGETTSLTLAGVELSDNAAYSWTVQAFDAKTSSSVSAAENFVVNTVDEAPVSPVLTAPEDNGYAAGADVLSWTVSVDPDPGDFISGYQVQIASDEGFTNILSTQATTANNLALGDLAGYAQFEDGASYFWRVTAFDRDYTPSEDNLIRHFTYDTSQLVVTVDVPDAKVYLGGNYAFSGRYLGVAPLQLRDLQAGAVSLVIEHPGFETYVATLDIDERANVSLAAVMVPAVAVDQFDELGTGVNGKNGINVESHAVPFLADFNNNGAPDLLVAGSAGTLKLFSDMERLRNGKIQFGAAVALNLPVLPGAVPFLVDWDNDGRKDLLVGLADGSIKLFRNQGDERSPLFAEGVDLILDSSTLNVGSDAAPAVVDYNGDNAKDLLVGNGSGQVQLFLNSGSDADPQLAAPITLFTVAGAVVPMSVDFDADGKSEIMATSSGITTLYAREDDGNFRAVERLGDGDDNFAAFLVDCAGREGKDLLVGGRDGRVSLWQGKGSDYVSSYQTFLAEQVNEASTLNVQTSDNVSPANRADNHDKSSDKIRGKKRK